MKNKQIDIITKYFYPVAAGIETNILETYSVLVKKGGNINIHTSTDTLTEKNALNPLDDIRGLKIIRYSFNKFGYFPKIEWEKTDLICLHNFDIFPHSRIMLYVLLRKLRGKKTAKIVLTPHGGFNPEWSTFPLLQAKIKKIYHNTIGVWLINQTIDLVRAVSEWESQAIIAKGVKKEKIIMIPNGVEKEAYMDLEQLASKEIKEQVKTFGRYLLQIGRIYKIKNYETTIRSLVSLPKDVKFIIAGPIQKDKRYQEYLERLVNELDLTGRVIFTGVIRGVDKYYLIKHAQMMIHMAIWESFCNVVHEGLSQGLICIVANNTALPYLIADDVNGYCIETKNHTLLAEKINFVLENKNSQLIKDMEKRNKVYGLANSWEKVAQLVNHTYNTL